MENPRNCFPLPTAFFFVFFLFELYRNGKKKKKKNREEARGGKNRVP
jgi:hypothetical protein